MHVALKFAAIGALLLAGGCAAPPPAADGAGGGETAAIPRGAVPHEDARFLVRRGSELYRVNVRYVDMLDKSVSAVRRGRGDADESWPLLEIEARGTAPSSVPFGAEAWRSVAVGICEAVRKQERICPEGKEMRLVRKRGGPVRTMYRENRQAWVVFAACRKRRTG